MNLFKPSLLTLLIFFSGIGTVSAQTNISPNTSIKKNNLCIEAGGTGLLYSFGYERSFAASGKTLQGLKVSVSYPFINGLNYILMPVDYHFYFGTESNKVFIGAGIIVLLGTAPSPNGFSAQKDFRNLYNSNPYLAIDKYNTDHYNSSVDIAYTGKVGYLHSFDRINVYAYYNCFYMRFTYKYHFQPLWFGAGVSFKL